MLQAMCKSGPRNTSGKHRNGKYCKINFTEAIDTQNREPVQSAAWKPTAHSHFQMA